MKFGFEFNVQWLPGQCAMVAGAMWGHMETKSTPSSLLFGLRFGLELDNMQALNPILSKIYKQKVSQGLHGAETI